MPAKDGQAALKSAIEQLGVQARALAEQAPAAFTAGMRGENSDDVLLRIYLLRDHVRTVERVLAAAQDRLAAGCCPTHNQGLVPDGDGAEPELGNWLVCTRARCEFGGIYEAHLVRYSHQVKAWRTTPEKPLP